MSICIFEKNENQILDARHVHLHIYIYIRTQKYAHTIHTHVHTMHPHIRISIIGTQSHILICTYTSKPIVI